MVEPEGFLWDSKSLNDDVFIKSPRKPKKATIKEIHAFASFGADGTTASVNGYGRIMQISRFLDFGASGFLCVDPHYERPYYIKSRMEEILESSTNPNEGLRLDIVDWTAFQDIPSMGFMFDRWPRYIFNNEELPKPQDGDRLEGVANSSGHASYSTKLTSRATEGTGNANPSKVSAPRLPFPLSIHFFCHGGAVVQTYLLHVGGDGGVPRDTINWNPISLKPDICIRGLDFVENHDFDARTQPKDLEVFAASGNNLFITRRKPQDIGGSEDTNEPAMNQERKPDVPTLIISVFINGEAATLDSDNCIRLTESKIGARLELSVIYAIKLLDQCTIDDLKASKKPDHPSSEAAKKTLQDVGATDQDATTTQRATSMQSSEVEHSPSLVVSAETPDQDKEDKVVAAISHVKDALKELKEVFDNPSYFSRIYFAPTPRFDFAFRRNLEHILSVCSIPVARSPTAKSEDAEVLNSWSEVLPIAITCGDVAGHRIGSRASLSAVQFLLSALKYLDPFNDFKEQARLQNRRANLEWAKSTLSDKDKEATASLKNETTVLKSILPSSYWYIRRLSVRIVNVLRGHVLWICTEALPWTDGTFAPYYWATGKPIENLSYLSQPSLLDTPLQLLKVLHCLDDTVRSNPFIYEDNKVWIEKKLRSRAKCWLKGLHVSNQYGTYAFPRRNRGVTDDYGVFVQGPDPKFSLTDHVMISLAISCIEELKRAVSDSKSPDEPGCYYTYREVRRKTLKRFTTEEPISKQRMLASSRWTDRTRFLLHSKDTFLLSATNMCFFLETKAEARSPEQKTDSESFDPWRFADDRWTSLLDAQANQDEFQYLEWSKPLWYVMVYVLGCKGRQVGDYSPQRLIREAHTTLLVPTWYNGLFAGILGHKRLAKCYDHERDCDDYWHAVFETANILWSCGTAGDPTTMQLESRSTPSTTTGGADALNPREFSRVSQKATKRVPFSNLSPSKGQLGRNALSDDWLQSSPAILGFESKPTHHFENLKKAETEAETNRLILECLQDWKNQKLERGTMKEADKQIGRMFLPGQKRGKDLIVIDVPRYSLGTEISDRRSEKRAPEHLASPRSVWTSKKRIIWLSDQNATDAMKVYSACSGIEKINVLSFFDQHQRAESHFLDSATAALNEWETELHFSFYSLSKTDVSSLYRLKEDAHLVSTTISFRFSGDFSDRFWTCLLLEHRPAENKEKTLADRLLPSPKCGIRGDLDLQKPHQRYSVAKRRQKREDNRPTKPWQQRKVLELLIYTKILEDIVESSNEILQTVKDLALRSRHSQSAEGNRFYAAIEEARQLQWLGDRENYASIARQWRKYVQILTVVEDSLTDNLEKIGEWQRRKEDRQDQQPRWTDRDQHNHFTTILRLTIFSDRKAAEITRLRDQVRAFRGSLPDQLASIREDIDFRGSQSINLFTYVTVVFLPLGFATGVLSMSGLPDHSTLMSLVYMALSALALTVFLLLNAEFIKKLASPIVKVYRTSVTFLCWLVGLTQLWQLIKYLVFHGIAAPVMTHQAQRNKRKKARQDSSTNIPSPNSPDEQKRNMRSETTQSKQHEEAKNCQKETWHERYKKIMEFEFMKAVELHNEVQEEVRPRKKGTQKPDEEQGLAHT
ncbi:hypothetical protein OPT61_g8502 [Boeremia exigua]|uniref:Uncharacterized protein n=1 Tax=Boeremia exigua TaxID=749465 RepID=A0ACC2HYD2_9PLEO|nr:hypothetical protein OPT61_g8502 [Boeremia exigua]